MVIVCSTVFLGTVYPLLVETFTNNKISVGEPYYNSTVIPIAIPAILIMGIGPLLSWQKEEKIKILNRNDLVPHLFELSIMRITNGANHLLPHPM